MGALASLALPMAIAGTALTAFGQYQQGELVRDQARQRAKALEQSGNEDAAAAQRNARLLRREGGQAQGRARAVGAASGAGGYDDIVEDLGAQSEFNVLNALYEGRARQQAKSFAAQNTREFGKQSRRQGILNAVGTIVSGGSTLYDRFGGKDTDPPPGNAYQDPRMKKPYDPTHPYV